MERDERRSHDRLWLIVYAIVLRDTISRHSSDKATMRYTSRVKNIHL